MRLLKRRRRQRTSDLDPQQQAQRRRLRRLVDRLFEGIDRRDPDTWVRTVLADIGDLIGTARDALDYETGRELAGVERAIGAFLVASPYPEWSGAALTVDEETAAVWIQLGRIAREQFLPPDTRRRALHAIFLPISRTSHHAEFIRLVDSLQALNFGEQPEIVIPSPTGYHGIGHGRDALRLRLSALAWIEFQVAARLMTGPDARKAVARAFGRDVRSIRDWPTSTEERLGRENCREAIEYARAAGAKYAAVKRQITTRPAADAASERLLAHFESAYGTDPLEFQGRAYRELPRKKTRG